MTDLQLALEEAAWEREDNEPLDSYEIALCIETDDFTPPRGRVLGSDAVISFPGSYGKVREGCVYFVPRGYGEALLYPFALLPRNLRRAVVLFRIEAGRRYPGARPWSSDTLDAWP